MDTSDLLRIALVARSETATAFAQSLTPPVSASMLYAVAAGRKSSAHVQSAIERLIAGERARVTRAFSAHRMAA